MLFVYFVTQENKGEALDVVRTCVLYESVLPFIKVFEALRICDIVHEAAAVCTSVEGVTEGLELLLAGCIPDLEGHSRVINCNLFLREVGSNSGLGRSCHFAIEELRITKGKLPAGGGWSFRHLSRQG